MGWFGKQVDKFDKFVDKDVAKAERDARSNPRVGKFPNTHDALRARQGMRGNKQRKGSAPKHRRAA